TSNEGRETEAEQGKGERESSSTPENQLDKLLRRSPVRKAGGQPCVPREDELSSDRCAAPEMPSPYDPRARRDLANRSSQIQLRCQPRRSGCHFFGDLGVRVSVGA